MPVFLLDEALTFPPVGLSQPDGLLAVGGDLSPERLLLAYRSGIFPWYNAPPVMWWSPHPRFVLFPKEFKISKSLKPLLARNVFTFTTNQAFRTVMQHCQKVPRPQQDGTWIHDEMIDSYCQLHKQGYAHSAEVWQNNELVGGLYGIKIGKVFFGESMFSLISNASRFAFAKYIDQLMAEGIGLIDCQVHTPYLESMGARMIHRQAFVQMLHKLIPSG